MSFKESNYKVKKKIRWGRVFIFLILFLFIFIYLFYRYSEYKIEKKEYLNIGIIGVDERDDIGGSRSDVMMIAHVDYNNDKVDLISIPRDSLVSIACRDFEDKITHSFFYGSNEGDKKDGITCAIDSMANLFNINNIDKYILLDFKAVVKVVDDLKGVEITPNKDFCEYLTSGEKYCFIKDKKEILDGEKALAYARHRYSDSDYYRAMRQQELINAILGKLKTLSKGRIIHIGNNILRKIDTNISLFEGLTYYKLIDRDNFVLNRYTLKGNDYYSDDGTYYYQLDKSYLEEIIGLLQR